jgi:hypothetical protein
MFRDSSDGIEEYTTSVTGFINKCIKDIVPTVTVCTYPNQKPLITGNIRTELKVRTVASRSGTLTGMHNRKLPSDTSLPDELNNFYAHFEASNTETCMRASAFPDDCVITLSVADVRPLKRSRFTRPLGQTDYQNVYSEHALTNWQVSSLTFSPSPCLSL